MVLPSYRITVAVFSTIDNNRILQKAAVGADRSASTEQAGRPAGQDPPATPLRSECYTHKDIRFIKGQSMKQFEVCFAPGRVGQEKCKTQCAECIDAQRRCTCGAASGNQRSRLARALCPYHQHTCSSDERDEAKRETQRAHRLTATEAGIRSALENQGYSSPASRAELLASVAKVLLEAPPAL
jgi:hypothetical protein